MGDTCRYADCYCKTDEAPKNESAVVTHLQHLSDPHCPVCGRYMDEGCDCVEEPDHE